MVVKNVIGLFTIYNLPLYAIYPFYIQPNIARLAVKIIFRIATGSRNFQPKLIN